MDKQSNIIVQTTNKISEHSEGNQFLSRTSIYLSRPKRVDDISKKVQPQKKSTEKKSISRTTIYLNQPKENQI